MIPNPIISLSLPKSGTTTLALALRRAGLKVIDWRIRPGQTKDKNLQGELIAPLMYQDYFDSGDPLTRFGEFHAITEMSAINSDLCMWPQTDSGMLNAILHHHPGARFLLSMREPAAVAQSIMGWNNLGRVRMPRHDVPGLPRPYGGNVDNLTRWVNGHYEFCSRFFGRSPNFLAYRLEDDDVRLQISRFLKLQMPWWGTANKNVNRNDKPLADATQHKGNSNGQA